jgi:UDP-2,3-diacylglucosamine pyrophosphatase LpxH
MLIIISDVHLGDGTCGQSISADAFHLFTDRLNELAYNASWRADGKYRPLERLEILLLGDILDALHSTRWLEHQPGEPGYARPWSNSRDPAYAGTLAEITHAILQSHAESAKILRAAAQGELVQLPPADKHGQPDEKGQRLPLKARIYYMVGNHDWFYHLPGPAFEAIRQEIVAAFGLQNQAGPFAWEAEESEALLELCSRYRVYPRHGDLYDAFNYDKEKGRDASSLGDVFTVEMLNRFPVEVERRLGNELDPTLLKNLRELTNIRPALAAPLWISGQISQRADSRKLQNKLKAIWDELGEEFINLEVVRTFDRWLAFDSVDALELLQKISKRTSFKTINEVVNWLRKNMWGGEISYSQHALKEKAFLDRSANYIVYGHTHHYEVVSLDWVGTPATPASQVYVNSGTWHTYYDLAVHRPRQQKFVPYQVLTYLAFYSGDERFGRKFEAWSGAYA